MSLVSVIIPAFNCERYIEQALNSILQQTHNDLEVLICDDCSSDKTWEILNTFGDNRIRLFQNKLNKGVVETRNFLFEQASGDFFLIQDADDLSVNTRIEKLIKEFQTFPTMGACASAHYRISNTGVVEEPLAKKSFFITMNDCSDLPFMPPTLIIRRQVYEAVGGYNHYFTGKFAEDLYWIVRIVEKYKVRYLDVPLYFYRFNPNSITMSIVDPKQFVVIDVVKELIRQRMEEQTDWIQQGNHQALQDFESRMTNNRSWLSEKFRIQAAVHKDGAKNYLAKQLLWKAWITNPFNFKICRTFFYIFFRN